MASRREVILGTAAGSLVAAASAQSAQANVRVHHEAPAGLRAHLATEMRNALIPGMQVAVVRRGRIVFLDVFGLADVENSVRATNATRFQIASVTKAFVGVAVMQLVQSGRLDLAAPITSYLEDLPAAWSAVTVGQIAAHTSGLPDIIGNVNNLRLLVDGDVDASWARVRTMPMQFRPGEQFSYNQTNYALLGMIIERVGGEPFSRFIQRRQLDAVGMPRTVYGDDHDVVMHSARTYTTYTLVNGRPERGRTLYKVYTEFPAMLRTCGGLNSTAEEIAHWLIALQQGQLLRSPSSLTTLRTARPLNNGERGPWGIGGFVFDRAAHPVFFSVGAAKSAFAVYPDDDLAVVVLTNLSADMWLPFLDAIAAHYFGVEISSNAWPTSTHTGTRAHSRQRRDSIGTAGS